MDARELRIGNYIASGEKYSDTSMIGKVLSIGSEEQNFEQIFCECEESFEWFFKDSYCGIELTPEWLERLGFKYNDGIRDSYSNEALELYGSPMESGWAVEAIFDQHLDLRLHRKIVINHLHQLQNLYFALTGEELTLSEPKKITP
jgi:hypothetical protein